MTTTATKTKTVLVEFTKQPPKDAALGLKIQPHENDLLQTGWRMYTGEGNSTGTSSYSPPSARPRVPGYSYASVRPVRQPDGVWCWSYQFEQRKPSDATTEQNKEYVLSVYPDAYLHVSETPSDGGYVYHEVRCDKARMLGYGWGHADAWRHAASLLVDNFRYG